MRVPFFQRLPVRLAGAILLMGFIAVPLVSELKRRSLERMVLQEAELQSATATIAMVAGLQDSLRSVEATVRFLARDLEDRAVDPAEVDRILHNAMAGSPDFSEFSISFEPDAAGPGTGRFGHYLYRSGSHLIARDLAAPDYHYWTQDWYADAISRGEVTWSEPFFDRGGANANVVRISAPFYRSLHGQRVAAGVVAAGLELGWIRRLIEQDEFFDTGYVVIFSPAGRIITHPNPRYVFNETMESLAQKTGNAEFSTIYQRVMSRHQGALSYYSASLHRRVHENYKPVPLSGWGVIVGYDEAEFLKHVVAFRWATLASLGATLALLAAIVLLVTALALKPLARLTAVSQEITRGSLDLEIPPPRRSDEIGLLTRSFVLMQETLKKNRALETSVRERTAEVAAANEKLTSEALERRWVNQALEHQLRYNELIINSIADLVIVCTKALNISRINPAVVRLTGWEATELVNTPLARLVRLGEAGRPSAERLVDPLVQNLKEGRDVRDQPGILTDKRGRETAVRLTLYPLRDRDKVVGGVAIIQTLS